MSTNKVWSKEEIERMWPQAVGELTGFQHALEDRSGLTASQLGMALQLADVGFKATVEAKTSPESFPVEVLDEIEAVFDRIIIRAHTKRDVPGILLIMPRIDDLWYALKQAREKAGRPAPKRD